MKSFEDLLQKEIVVSMFGQKIIVSIFLIDGLLIDTGPLKKKKELIPLFEQWEINKVILTHHHEDHTGLASWIQENKKIPIYIHEKGIKECEKKVKLPLYRQVFWGERAPFRPMQLEDTFQTNKYTWDIIHTPGHADDHVAIYNREKGWMFGGDLYVQPTPKSMFAFESVPAIIDSLRIVLMFDFETYICSHAGVIPQGREAIEKKLDYLISVQEQVLFLHGSGMSPQAIRKKLFPKNHPINYLSFFESSPRHFVNSILAGSLQK